MNFLIYDDKDSDRPGLITQSNKVFSPEGYHDVLRERGLNFAAIEHHTYLHPERFFIKDGEPVERPLMPVKVSKTTIRAGGSDAAIFSGVPKNATAICSVRGAVLGSAVIPTGIFDLPIPIPCIYHVTIALWPYQDFNVDIEAIA